MAKVSIAVSFYNVEQYIERCVRSLMEQTLDDMEFVFVDDASTDESLTVFERVVADYPQRQNQVKVLRHESNMGAATGKRDSMLATTGEYVIVVDGDDYVEPDMAERLYAKAIGEDADMVLCGLYHHHNDGSVVENLSCSDENAESERLRMSVINRTITPSLSVKLIRRSIIGTSDFAWPTHDYAEDVAISVQAAYLSKKVVSLLVALYHYCYNPKSVCNLLDRSHLLKTYDDIKSNVQVVFDFLHRKGVYEQYGQCVYNLSVYAKCALLPLVGERKYRKMWFATYPEINKVILRGNDTHHSRIREKIWYLSIWSGLYPKVRKYLISDRLKMRNGWNWGAVVLEKLYRGSA